MAAPRGSAFALAASWLLSGPAVCRCWAWRFRPGSVPPAEPPAVVERELQTFGVPWYPDWPPQPTWGDLSARGRLGATCDAEKDAAVECGTGLVCRNDICRHCLADQECPSLHSCRAVGRGGGRCVPIGKRAWEQALTDRFEALCSIIVFFAAALSAGAGMGGGGMFVPLLTSLSGLKPEQAVPLSQAMILCGSIVNISVFLAQRHPRHPALPVIDYNCVVLLAPMLFLGVTLGVLVNQMSPQWLLLVLLCASLGVALWRTSSKGMQQLHKERLVAQPAGVAQPSLMFTPRPVDHTAVFVELTNKNAWQVVGTVAVWLLMLISSGHGIAVCSSRFAGFLVLLAFLLVSCTAMAARYIARASQSEGQDSSQDDAVDATPRGVDATPRGVDATPRWVAEDDVQSSMRFPLVGFGAGFLGGLLGLGGGMIMSPVLLEVGMHSEAVQSTTAVFVLLSSSVATIQFAVLGQHVWDYVLWYCAITVAATFLGQHLCEVFVRKSGRYSLITLAIAGVLGASLLALLIVGMQRVADDLALGRQMWFSTERLCTGGGLGIVVVDVLPSQDFPADPLMWRG